MWRSIVSTNTPKVVDNDRDEITAALEGKETRGWSYSNEDERRMKITAAREFCEGWYQAMQQPKQAAALTMYEALEELNDALDDGLCNSGIPGFDSGRLGRAQDAARAALALARGERS
jgi:hypothetical protein